MKKLLFIIPTFFPLVGGAETVCYTLARYFVKKGYSVTILTQRIAELPDEEILEGIRVHRKIGHFGIYWVSYMVSVFIYLVKNRKNYECVLLFGLYLTTPPAVLAGKLFKKAIIQRLECGGSFGDIERMKKIKGGFLVEKSLKHLSLIIAISKEIEEELRRFTRKVIFMPNFIEYEKFDLKREKSNRIYDDATILFVGRLAYQKGIEILLEAIGKLKGNYPFKVKLVGSGSLADVLVEKVETLGISKLVSFEGQRDVFPYYKDADIFVLPSRAEGMSIALLEAMASGLPVVVTDVSGTRDVVQDGVNGFVVPPEDVQALEKALRRLIEDRELAWRMGQEARKTIEKNYTVEAVGKKYENILNNFCNI